MKSSRSEHSARGAGARSGTSHEVPTRGRTPIRPRRRIGIVVASLAFMLLAGCIALAVVVSQVLKTRSPNELIRYAKTRLEGHLALEKIVTPALNLLQRRFERPVNGVGLPALGKGQQPLPANALRKLADVVVTTPEQIRAALQQAKAGTTIEIAPGSYRFGSTLRLRGAGTRDAPIIVRAEQPNTVMLEFAQEEGVLVNQPWWVFENLNIRGVCARDHDCEHAFHVVGKAENLVLRNNFIQDFNAHIKVNGVGGSWPDSGLLAYNTLTNLRPRQTARPVSPFDLVGASRWQVLDNVVSNFAKRDGNRVSYGIFMKGAGEGGRIERNLVICSLSEISQRGARVGISFGGGGTNASSCRDKSCAAFEHHGGLAANNIVAHCNDTGLDVNHSAQITLAHNTLINTSGISVRSDAADTRLYGNLYEGRVRNRGGRQVKEEFGQPMNGPDVFDDGDHLALHWRTPLELIPSTPLVPVDFCSRKRRDGTSPGALTADPVCAISQ